MNRLAFVAVLASCTVLSGAEPYRDINGIYPHLAMYNSGGECGTGVVVPWADRLWIVTYSPHSPKGSDDKLYEIMPDLGQVVRPESIGGTPANRMIHRESNQLIIGPYFIDDQRNVRVIPYEVMPGRHTGNARHLTDPAGKVYFATMEEGLYEVDVQTLDVHCFMADHNSGCAIAPGIMTKLPGYHGKGVYSGQGRLIYANNGERAPEIRTDPTIPSGGLGQWFGEGDYELVRRNQFTEVTGPGGIYGNPNPDEDPIWSIGWDYRSLILMLLDNGRWHTFRLPKSSHSYDGSHGWNTEWPRIRDIGEKDLTMTMHGCFWHFPRTFSLKNSAGIRPRSNYLKVIGDFCRWGDRLVLGCDDSAKSEFINTRPSKSRHGAPGQSNSNIWFISPETIDTLGPPIGRGSVWLRDDVKANAPSDPYLFSGYRHRMVQITHESPHPLTVNFEVDREGTGNWSGLRTMTVPPGGSAFHVFTEKESGVWIRASVDKDASGVSLHFHYRNDDPRTEAIASIYDGVATTETAKPLKGVMRCLGGDKRALGMIAFDPEDDSEIGYYELDAQLNLVRKEDPSSLEFVGQAAAPAEVYEVDAASVILVEDGRRYRIPKNDAYGAAEKAIEQPIEDPESENLALGADVTVSSTLDNYDAAYAVDGKDTEESRWVSAQQGEKWIALDLGFPKTIAAARISSGYNRGLGTAVKDAKLQIKEDDQWKDVPGGSVQSNNRITFVINLAEPVTAQHVRLVSSDEGYMRIYELELYEQKLKDRPMVGELNVTRVCREVVTERDLFNCHGTFYELPSRNAQGFAKIRPVATHSLAVHDYCSYRGMMLFTGIDPSALKDSHDRVLVSNDGKTAIWAGVIDELWKLGKPRGEGGPWKDHEATAGEPSDPYLMTGYDKKSVTLSHDQNQPVSITLEVDIDGTGIWMPYKTFEVAPGETLTHEFPEGYSAYWVRATADKDCVATALFVYE